MAKRRNPLGGYEQAKRNSLERYGYASRYNFDHDYDLADFKTGESWYDAGSSFTNRIDAKNKTTLSGEYSRWEDAPMGSRIYHNAENSGVAQDPRTRRITRHDVQMSDVSRDILKAQSEGHENWRTDPYSRAAHSTIARVRAKG